ncbi:Protein phosphatase methylesterase 1 [Mycena indigotica]|uniref:Protein phosphatase methylesterase 1 n=1 Tax=Mycena indigotica TaxID=2126181 RepID=A0A8H6WCV9_9AGAR|nr:Protein phosphatase methylesterase 1 [Mycena indigotica]KAF7311836.1 Protein phosphatase methylesterase 1 [Mycena indigotica]
MSDLLRSAMAARLAKLPADLPPMGDEDEDNEETEAHDSLGSLPGSGMGPPAAPRTRPKPSKRPPNPDFAPLSASSYFSEALQVAIPERGLDVRAYYTPPKFAGGTVFVCHHGAGYSGLSFACFAKEVVEMARGEVGVLALDARRHGKTRSTTDPEPVELDIATLVDDFVAIVQTVFPHSPNPPPPLLLIGHSMGGAVVAHSSPRLQAAGFHLLGIAVLDVVEGSAVEALPHMHNLLNARPDGFDSVEDAIEWHVKTKTIRNDNSARVSVPAIVEAAPSSNLPAPHAWIWRTPLRSTAPYWMSWFQDLSMTFLAARTARLLLLAGTDRLDKPLMIAQMQGKFQLHVLGGGNVGHMLHEDDPTRVAEVLLEFWRRNDTSKLKLPVKIKGVGEA